MVDRDSLARLPARAFRCLQASSYDRAQTDPSNPKTWFANHDYEQFIRIETNEGRKEWVIMEHQGPGCIVRFWIPLHGAKNNQLIRFYFDGAKTPSLAREVQRTAQRPRFRQAAVCLRGLRRKGHRGRRRRPLPADPLRLGLQDHARPTAVLLQHQLSGLRAGHEGENLHDGRLRSGCRPA